VCLTVENVVSDDTSLTLDGFYVEG
jgi:hypothetical protein